MKRHLHLLPDRVDVSDLVTQLAVAPHLWDQFPMRTEEPTSPHHKLSDIFVRYNARGNYNGNRADFNERHIADWWLASDELPAAVRLSFEVMHMVDGEHLGMVLITRIPPFTNCERHVDGGWHASFFDKYAVQVKSARGQCLCFDGERLEAEPGDVYRFDNEHTHWVENQTKHERITLIVCIRNRMTGVK